MNVALWIAQGLLAGVFFMAGAMKLMKPKSELAEQMGWVEHFSASAIKGIGVVEILGALGLILPGITGVVPVLVPSAAVGLGIAQVSAASLHARRGGEGQMIMMNVVFIAVAAFVAWGRFGDYQL